MGAVSAGALFYHAGEQHPYLRRVSCRLPDAQLQAYKKIIDLTDVVLCVSGTDAPASSGAEDAALTYALAQKPLVLLHPTELTTMRIGWPFRTG